MLSLAVGDSFTASFCIRPMIAANLELSFIWAEYVVLFKPEWCRDICCRSRIQLPLNQIFFFAWIWYWAIFAWDRCVRYRYSKRRNRIYCCILFDGKVLPLSHLCLGPRVIAVGSSAFSYCKAKRVYFWPSCESRHAKHCDGRRN